MYFDASFYPCSTVYYWQGPRVLRGIAWFLLRSLYFLLDMWQVLW